VSRVNLRSARDPKTWWFFGAFVLAVALGYFVGRWVIGEIREGRLPNWFSAHESIVLETGERTFIAIHGDEPWHGSADALVTIIVFADFECPACAEAFLPLKDAMERHYDSVRVIFKHYPLPRHDRALPAAYAAWAAHQQTKFWPAAEALFERAGNLDDLPKLIHLMGLDGPQFWQDIRSERGREAIDRDQLAGGMAQVRGTPTFFVNGHRYLRQWDRETWDAVIQHETKAAHDLLDQGIAADQIYKKLTKKDPTP